MNTETASRIASSLRVRATMASKFALSDEATEVLSSVSVGVARSDHPLFDGSVTAKKYAAYRHVNASRRGIQLHADRCGAGKADAEPNGVASSTELSGGDTCSRELRADRHDTQDSHSLCRITWPARVPNPSLATADHGLSGVASALQCKDLKRWRPDAWRRYSCAVQRKFCL